MQHQYYTYDNSVNIDLVHFWEGSKMGDMFGYSEGPVSMFEFAWNNSVSAIELDHFKYSNYDILVTVLEGKIYAEDTLWEGDSVWIPSDTYINVWATTR